MLRSVARVHRCVRLARAYATPAQYAQQEADPQLGDYLNPPYISRQRLPAKGWSWDPQMRRNFGDPMHEREEILSMWGPDIPVVEPKQALRHFLIAASLFISFGATCKLVLTNSSPVVPREYPFDGLVKELGGLEENKAPAEQIDED